MSRYLLILTLLALVACSGQDATRPEIPAQTPASLKSQTGVPMGHYLHANRGTQLSIKVHLFS